jgi:hypothetical protein
MKVYQLSDPALQLYSGCGYAIAAVEDGHVVDFVRLPAEGTPVQVANATGGLLIRHPLARTAFGMLSCTEFVELT